jgi:hypothetical protein
LLRIEIFFIGVCHSSGAKVVYQSLLTRHVAARERGGRYGATNERLFSGAVACSYVGRDMIDISRKASLHKNYGDFQDYIV